MSSGRPATVLLALLIGGTLLSTGPLVTGETPGGSVTGLDDGTATVSSVEIGGPLEITDGRFGTGVAYLRVPDATIELASVDGRPRAVYRVEVPALGVDRSNTESLAGDPSRVRIGVADQAVRYNDIDRDIYESRVTVRIQSFAVDRTVLRRNETVEVRTGD